MGGREQITIQEHVNNDIINKSLSSHQCGEVKGAKC